MSISETRTVDIVASRPDSRVVKLVITDHLPWDELDAHLLLLQEKINTYVTFVESGQLARLKEPRIPDEPEIHIVVRSQFNPPAEAESVLARMREFLRGLGLAFSVELATGSSRIS